MFDFIENWIGEVEHKLAVAIKEFFRERLITLLVLGLLISLFYNLKFWWNQRNIKENVKINDPVNINLTEYINTNRRLQNLEEPIVETNTIGTNTDNEPRRIKTELIPFRTAAPERTQKQH